MLRDTTRQRQLMIIFGGNEIFRKVFRSIGFLKKIGVVVSLNNIQLELQDVKIFQYKNCSAYKSHGAKILVR